MAVFPVAECFVSINGESVFAGKLAVFIRFTGCNLQCSYCDTMWANHPDTPYTACTEQALCQFVQESGVKHVTLTGGEPLLQPELPVLLQALAAIGVQVEIETNGSLPIQTLASLPYRPAFTLDYKLPDSGMESAMLTDNYACLQPQDAVKFVAGSLSDLDRAREIIETYRLAERCHVFLSAVFGKLDGREIVTYMQQHRMNNVRLQLQMHKLIWDPQERGV